MNSPAHWQLFLDDFHIARSTGFDRVVHHPRCRGVVIPADKPWETFGLHPAYVERLPGGMFICFYQAMWWDIDRAQSIKAENFRRDRPHQVFSAMAYAESDDGIHWRKPSFGLVEAPAGVEWTRNAPFPSPVGTSRENNLGVPFSVVANLHRDGDVTDPARRYVLRVTPNSTGVFDVAQSEVAQSPQAYFAADLPRWRSDPGWMEKLTPIGSDLSLRGHGVNFWDRQHEEWVKISQGVMPNWLPSREMGRFASKNLKDWTSRSVLYPDSADRHDLECYDEPMEMVPWCAEGVVFGILGWFHSDRSHPDGGPNLRASDAHPFIWPWARKGTCEIRITMSRDGGNTWDRTSSRQAWIPHSTEFDAPDRVLLWGPPPVHVGDEDWFYIYSANQDHLASRNNPEQGPYHHSGPSIRQTMLYTQKHNRFVSMRARNQPAILITRPIEVNGDTLQLNVDADRGIARVGIAPTESVPTFEGTVPSNAPHLLPQHLLEGFSFADCEPIRSNSIQHEVRFTGQQVASLRGKAVCLLFELTDADLYGFRWV